MILLSQFMMYTLIFGGVGLVILFGLGIFFYKRNKNNDNKQEDDDDEE